MSKNKALVYVKNIPAAVLTKHEQTGPLRYEMRYLGEYLERTPCHMVCYQMPPRPESYFCEHLFPFFESLLPEGDNLIRICRELKIDEKDRFSQLLRLAMHDTIGDVTIRAVTEE